MPLPMPPTKIHINQKFIEIIFNLLIEQNKQLLKIIAEDNGWKYKAMVRKYVPTRQDFHDHFTNVTPSLSRR